MQTEVKKQYSFRKKTNKRTTIPIKGNSKFCKEEYNFESPSFGPYKMVSFEKKLIQADTILACSPFFIFAVIFAHYLIW